jgi:hypothetical protein
MWALETTTIRTTIYFTENVVYNRDLQQKCVEANGHPWVAIFCHQIHDSS